MHTSYEKLLQPWVYPRSFPQKERAAIYNIPIKPCLRSLIQRYSVERIRLNKTWMTLKLTKILVSLLVMNPLKKNDKGSDDPEYDPKFLHQILLKSCEHWKELQKVFFQYHSTEYHELPFKSTLQISPSTSQSENRMYVQNFVKVHFF